MFLRDKSCLTDMLVKISLLKTATNKYEVADFFGIPQKNSYSLQVVDITPNSLQPAVIRLLGLNYLVICYNQEEQPWAQPLVRLVQ